MDFKTFEERFDKRDYADIVIIYRESHLMEKEKEKKHHTVVI